MRRQQRMRHLRQHGVVADEIGQVRAPMGQITALGWPPVPEVPRQRSEVLSTDQGLQHRVGGGQGTLVARPAVAGILVYGVYLTDSRGSLLALLVPPTVVTPAASNAGGDYDPT